MTITNWPSLATLLCFCSIFTAPAALAQTKAHQVVRIAEIEIHAHQIAQYRSALQEQIEAAIRLEPGVLTLYAVSIKEHPEQIRVFEVYASPAAYQQHIETSHFKKYKATTASMVKSLKLMDVDPIALGAQK